MQYMHTFPEHPLHWTKGHARPDNTLCEYNPIYPGEGHV